MANPDKPRGFTPIKHISGAPWTGQVRTITPKDGVDIFIGDALNLDTGTADVAASADTAFLGVAVGFGKVTDFQKYGGPAMNGADLSVLYYDDSANTNTDWLVYYVPAEDMIFEVQSDSDLDLAIGDTADLGGTTGSTTTGRSQQEITTSSNTDVTVVEIPTYPDNDSTLANTRYWVQFITTAFAQ